MTSGIDYLLQEGIITEVLGRLQSGKEAEVFIVRYGDRAVAAKAYKDKTQRSFKNSSGYKEGRAVRNSRDQRAMSRGSSFGRAATEDAWKSAEVEALYTLHRAGVRVPTPVMYIEGVLLMELVLGEDESVAPRIIDTDLDAAQANAAYHDMLSQLVKILACDLIHGDLSPYNVLWGAAGPTIIDFPQIISAAHNSRAEWYFLRDARNILGHFAAIDPTLRARAGDADEIWRVYAQRELTPDFLPRGRAQIAPAPRVSRDAQPVERAPRAPASADVAPAAQRRPAAPPREPAPSAPRHVAPETPSRPQRVAPQGQRHSPGARPERGSPPAPSRTQHDAPAAPSRPQHNTSAAHGQRHASGQRPQHGAPAAHGERHASGQRPQHGAPAARGHASDQRPQHGAPVGQGPRHGAGSRPQHGASPPRRDDAGANRRSGPQPPRRSGPPFDGRPGAAPQARPSAPAHGQRPPSLDAPPRRQPPPAQPRAAVGAPGATHPPRNATPAPHAPPPRNAPPPRDAPPPPRNEAAPTRRDPTPAPAPTPATPRPAQTPAGSPPSRGGDRSPKKQARVPRNQVVEVTHRVRPKGGPSR